MAKTAKSKTAKKSTAPKAKAKTVRLRILEFVAKNGESTASEIRDGINLSHGCKPTCDEEVELGNMADAAYELESGADSPTYYSITPQGRKTIAHANKNGGYDLRGGEES